MSNEETRVSSFGWSEIREINNLQDFDALILNLLASPSAADWQSLYELLDATAMVNIVQAGGEIVVLGDPRSEIETSLQGRPKIRRPFLEWTTVSFEWHNERGDTVDIDVGQGLYRVRNYLEHLKKWNYALEGVEQNHDQLDYVLGIGSTEGKGVRARLQKTALARNRYKKEIAFQLRFVIEAPDDFRGIEWQKLSESGAIVFLPQTELSEQESLLLLLKDLYDIETGTLEPQWIVGAQAPGQLQLDEQIARLEEEITQLQSTLADTRTQRKQGSRMFETAI
jgi:hypothetical protein